jgi:hypothetical protein
VSADATLELLIQIRDELAGLNRTRTELRGAKKDAFDLGEAIKQGLGIGTGMALVTSAVQMLRSSLMATAGQALQFAGATKDAAEAIGISTTALQVLQLEMKKAGVDSGRLTEAIAAQKRSLADARDGTSRMAEAYRDLGLEAAAVELLPIEQRLVAVARAVEHATDKSRAFNAASEILGSRGLQQMLNGLRRLGNEGVESLTAYYDKQGLIMNDETLERLDRASKRWQDLWHTIVIGSGEALLAIDTFSALAAGITPQGGMGLAGYIATRQAGAPAGTPAGSSSALSSDDVATAQARAAAATAFADRVKSTVAALEAVFKAGAETTAAVVTPYEKYEQTVAALRQQLELGAIDHLTFGRAVQIAGAELHKTLEATDAETAALKAQGEAVRQSILAPLEEFGAKLRELDRLQKAGIISAEEYARAAALAYTTMEYQERPQRPEGALGGYNEFLEALGTQSQQVADIVSQGLGAAVSNLGADIWDAMKGTQEWSDAFRGLGDMAGRMLTQIIAQMLVVQAINAVLGIFGFELTGAGPSIGKVAAAGGGTFVTRGPTHFTVGDNPGGVEMVSVVPISGVGRSSINGHSLAMAGGGTALVGGGGSTSAGGDTFNFTYQFNGGVSREEVLGMLPGMVRATKAAVLEAQRRKRDGF